jgi:hypothetical protein
VTHDIGWFERATLQKRLWSRVLLVSLALDLFVVPPLITLGVLPPWFAAVASTIKLVAAAAALGGHRAARGFIVAVVAAAILSRWLHHFVGGMGATAVLTAAVSAIAVGTFAGLLLADVFGRGKLPDRLFAVLLAYILLGAAWAHTYHAIELVFPGAFALPGTAHPTSLFIYFSFVTLTSLGYGDVLAVNPLVRSLAVVEALTGQLYLVLVVSRFVGEAAAGRGPPDG